MCSRVWLSVKASGGGDVDFASLHGNATKIAVNRNIAYALCVFVKISVVFGVIRCTAILCLRSWGCRWCRLLGCRSVVTVSVAAVIGNRRLGRGRVAAEIWGVV